MVGIPSLSNNDRFRDYRDDVINHIAESLPNVTYEIFVTPPQGREGWPGVVDACNLLAEKCLLESWDYLWIVEGDIQVPSDAFEKLYALDVDIAQGFYASHNDFNRIVVGFLDYDMTKIWYLPRSAVEGNILSGWVFAGLGCTLIKRRVLEKIKHQSSTSIFKHQPWTGCGHDVIFMHETQKAGFVAKVHGSVECGHLPEWPLPEKFESLDVGCGDNPQGDVNCDVHVGRTQQGGVQTGEGIVIDPKKIGNFVRCDGQALPFRDGAFEKVQSFQVIEHVPDPNIFLNELIRVSRRFVEVRCPHHLSHFAKLPFHLHVFEPSWFGNVLRKFDNITFDVSVDEIGGKPNDIIVKIFRRVEDN